MPDVSVTLLDRVIGTLESRRFNFVHEEELQAGIEQALTTDGFTFAREKHLGKDRIDFLIENVGLEVKVKGSLSAVTRQLHRYAQFDEIAGLILVTSRIRHDVGMPSQLNDKPLRVVTLLAL